MQLQLHSFGNTCPVLPDYFTATLSENRPMATMATLTDTFAQWVAWTFSSSLLLLFFFTPVRWLTWSPGWRKRSRTPAPVRPVRQARRLPLRSPSRLPATSFPPTALLRRPGIGFALSLDVGGRRFQFGRNSVTESDLRGRQAGAGQSCSTGLAPLRTDPGVEVWTRFFSAWEAG